MKKMDSFIGKYPISKTLRFKLLPVGKTLENFETRRLLEADKQRAADYVLVKGYIDRYHRAFIDDVLSRLTLSGVDRYAELYYKPGKSDAEKKSIEKQEEELRKAISSALKKDERYTKLFGKELIRELLPSYLTDTEELDRVSSFNNFTTYFTGFFQNRENIYSPEAQSTAIGYRCINENLPRFLDNAKCFARIREHLPEDDLAALSEHFPGYCDYFRVDRFDFVLSQSGITAYNNLLGGFVPGEGVKIQGINEYINLYNQTHSREDRLPKLTMLYKQILSERESVSFIPEAFETDDAVLEAVSRFYTEEQNGKSLASILDDLYLLFESIGGYDMNSIFIRAGSGVTGFANTVCGSWSAVQDAWLKRYDDIKAPKKRTTTYEENRAKAYKAVKSFSVAELISLAGEAPVAEDYAAPYTPGAYFRERILSLTEAVSKRYAEAEKLLTEPYTDAKRLAKNDDAIVLIKNFLDCLKDLALALKPFLGTGQEDNRDDSFYGDFRACYDRFSSLDLLYDRVRNHITKKPFSTDKIKLNFENPQFLNGWDRNKEPDYSSVLFCKDGVYYLGIMAKGSTRSFVTIPASTGNEPCYRKMNYKLLPGPNKMLPKVFFAKSNIEYFAPSAEILRIRVKETFKKGENFNLDDCRKLIDFYKASIASHPEWSAFGFVFRPTEEYNDIGEFFTDVKNQGYAVTYDDVPVSYVSSLIDSGALYLFQIYNKDFSPNSHGTPNLHTLYFRMLFDERNLRDVVFKLNGESEMFYRPASIAPEEQIVHPAGQPIENKNPANPNKTSTFAYPLTKNKRYTEPQFMLHVPITLNFKADGRARINEETRLALHDCPNNYVIGIDRGERNLLYVCVIDGAGRIVEQHSLNEIVYEYRGISHKTDYHALLDERERKRNEARQNWTTMENIKELKEGYLSQVIHFLCELMVKYDAVIAMENLDSGFKNSRFKVEKQVYQKFEKMLIDKLNFLADKNAASDAPGGLLRAYQLTEKFESFRKMGVQNGFIFYIPPWLTSKVDPVTGFVALLHPKYTSVEASGELFRKLDALYYDKERELFVFAVDYSKFPNTAADWRKQWSVCSYGTRIAHSVNAQGQHSFREVSPTEELKALFRQYSIDYTAGDLRAAIADRTEKDFHKRLTELFALTLQMRNSNSKTGEDYLISPVADTEGRFFDSRAARLDEPKDADANGAYNIARKAQWAIRNICKADPAELMKARISISNAEWLEYIQRHE